MPAIGKYLVSALTLIGTRLAEVRAVEVPATGTLRAIQATKSLYPDPRPLVYLARRKP